MKTKFIFEYSCSSIKKPVNYVSPRLFHNSIWQILPKFQRDKLDYDNLKKMCDDFPLGIILCDKAGRCLYSNHAYTNILGYAPGELLHQDWHACLYIEDSAQLNEKWKQAVLNRTPLQDDVRLIRADDAMIWARLHASMLEDAEYPFASLLMVEDISERKAMENIRGKRTRSSYPRFDW
jgi:PAS domain S-box-containing protein